MPSIAIEAGQIPDTGGEQQQQEQPFTDAGQPCMVRSREQELVRHRGRKRQMWCSSLARFDDQIESNGQKTTFWIILA